MLVPLISKDILSVRTCLFFLFQRVYQEGGDKWDSLVYIFLLFQGVGFIICLRDGFYSFKVRV